MIMMMNQLTTLLSEFIIIAVWYKNFGKQEIKYLRELLDFK